MKTLQSITLLLALLLNACTAPDGSTTDLATSLSELPPPNLTHGLAAFNTPPPLYPVRARNLNLEGWVMLSFNVDDNGSVLANSIDPVQAQPPGYFEGAAIAAARRMRFDNPRNETVRDVRWVFRFELEDDSRIIVEAPSIDIQFRELIPMRFITPEYPANALQRGLEGYVLLNMTVFDTGAVGNITVTESNPPGVFDSAAIEAAIRLRFEPRIVFDEAVTVDDVPFRFDWEAP